MTGWLAVQIDHYKIAKNQKNVHADKCKQIEATMKTNKSITTNYSLIRAID